MFRTFLLSIIRSFSLQVCWQQAVSKPVWHIPLLCVQWKTPDDGQRKCQKHVEFYSKNKFEKLVHLVGFVIRTNVHIKYQINTEKCPHFINHYSTLYIYFMNFYLCTAHISRFWKITFKTSFRSVCKRSYFGVHTLTLVLKFHVFWNEYVGTTLKAFGFECTGRRDKGRPEENFCRSTNALCNSNLKWGKITRSVFSGPPFITILR